jgi:spermidine/putrescine transport system substrate-binding protein
MLAAAALVLGMSAAHADDSKTLYFYNWTEYVPPGLLEQFTKETGIKVIYSTYESNETMYAKLKTYKDGAYDLVVPSTYFVDKMRKEGMIQKIDKTKLSHFNNLDPRCSTSRSTRITTTPFRISGGNGHWRQQRCHRSENRHQLGRSVET